MNQLKMDLRQSIITLTSQGRSQREIARELGINRETVAKYRHAAPPAADAKPAMVPAGPAAEAAAKPAIPPTGSPVPEPIQTAGGTEPKPAILPAGSGAGRKSQCEPFRLAIEAGWELGLSAQRIYQDLVSRTFDTGTGF